jgi:hypothetical protein
VDKSAPKNESASEENGSSSKSAPKPAGKTGQLGPLHFIAIGLAVVGVLLILLLSGGEDDSGSDDTVSAKVAAPAVQVVSESELLGAMEGVGYPVYWAGPRLGVRYEVSRPEDGRTFVRYLPKGEEAESDKPFLTVASYQQPEALASIRELGQKPGAVLVRIVGGGAAYTKTPQATSAYLAFPGVETQIEVYDPKPGKALDLIRSGAIVPVG